MSFFNRREKKILLDYGDLAINILCCFNTCVLWREEYTEIFWLKVLLFMLRKGEVAWDLLFFLYRLSAHEIFNVSSLNFRCARVRNESGSLLPNNLRLLPRKIDGSSVWSLFRLPSHGRRTVLGGLSSRCYKSCLRFAFSTEKLVSVTKFMREGSQSFMSEQTTANSLLLFAVE